MRRIVLSPEAKAEIREITAYSHRNFGPEAASRYAGLIRSGIRLVAQFPSTPGVRRLGARYHMFHLRLLTDTMGVSSPRHVLVFGYDGKRLDILHVFHDAMDLPARLGDL